MKERPFTNKELFDIIHGQLKENNLLPDILEYGLNSFDEVPIRSYHWDTIGIVNFGSSEGIYLDIYAWGNVTQEDKQEKIKLATYKTLHTDKEAFKVMSDLNAEFVFAMQAFVNANMDDFLWTGKTVRFYNTDGAEDYAVICFGNNDADLTAKHYLKLFPDRFGFAEVTDNATRKTHRIEKEN